MVCDRDASVAKCYHLVDTAWLKTGWKKNNIRPRIQGGLIFGVKRNDAKMFLVFPFNFLEKLEQFFIAVSHNHEFDVLPQKGLDDIHDEPVPFLFNDAGSHTQKGNVRVNRELEMSLQPCLICRFLVDGRIVIVAGEAGVGERVVFIVINAVDDAEHDILPIFEDAMQVLTKVLRQYFLAVCFGDGVDDVCAEDCALCEIDARDLFGVVKRRKRVVPVVAKVWRHFPPVASELVCHIVNGIYAGGFLPKSIGFSFRLDKGGDETGMPIVRMDDVRLMVQILQQCKYCKIEEIKTRIFSLVSVERFLLLEEFAVGDKVYRYAARGDAPIECDRFHESRVLSAVFQLDRRRPDALNSEFFPLRFGYKRIIKRHNNRHIVSELFLCIRKRCGDYTETA